nr:hypothetical protein [Rikenellaceae bacterium]
MKNLLKVFAVAVAVVLAACSKDSVEAPAVTADEAQVTFTTTIPGATEGRAIADGTTVDKLYYAVYEHGQTQALITDEEDVVGKTATVNVTLVSGMKYDIVFWAQKEGAPYTFNTTDNCIDINWTNLVGNNEARDAFIFVRKALEVNGSIQETITLKRPFAQLNIGISDFEAAKAAGFELAETKVSVDSYNQINFFGGEAYSKADGTGDYGMPAGTETPVTFACAAPLTDPATITIKGTTYKYVAMDYILPAMPTDAYDVDITFCTANEAKQYSVPTFAGVTFERNHRTNIMGSLLTDPGKFVIEIDEEFDDPDYTIAEAWDGVETVKPALVNGYYEISSPAHWAWLAKNGVGGNNLKLTSSINFNNHEIKAVAFGNGEFDGQGYTMSNMIPLQTGNYSVGLFNPTVSANANITIKNLTIAGAVIDSYFPDYGYAAVLFGDFQNSATLNLNGVTVKDTKIKGVQSVAAFVGLVASGTTVNIADCSVENSYLTNYSVDNESGFVCGMAGKVVGTVNFTGANTIKDTTIDGLYAARRGDRSIEWAAATYDSTTGTITGANTVTVSGGALNEIPLANVSGVIATTADLKDALTNGDTYITLGDNATFDLTQMNGEIGDGVIINGGENSVLSALNMGNTNEPYYVDGNVTFNNVKIQLISNTTGYGTGINSRTGKIVYNNCDFEGTATVWSECVFNNCTFTNTVDGQYAAWVYNGKAEYNNCTFSGVDRAAKVYTESGSNATAVYTDCKFNAQTPDKTAIDIDSRNISNKYYNVTITNAQVTNMGTPEDYGTEYFNIRGNNVLVNLDGTLYAIGDLAAAKAISVGGNIMLANGTYNISNAPTADTTIKGAGKANTIVLYKDLEYNLNNKSVTFEDMTIKRGNTIYTGFAHSQSENFKNCKLEGQFFLYGVNANFEGCEFEQTTNNYNVWTYGAQNITFKQCSFHSTMGKSLLIFQDGTNNACSVTVDNCTFVGDAAAQTWNGIDITAMDIDSTNGISYELNIINPNVTGYAVGSVSGTNVWNHKAGPAAKVQVNIDGTKVYPL